MPSFDIVSRIDMQEVDNAVNLTSIIPFAIFATAPQSTGPGHPSIPPRSPYNQLCE